MDEHQPGILTPRRPSGQRADRRGSAAALRPAVVGVRLPRPLYRVLVGTRQSFLGWDLGGNRMPAAAWSRTAQGLVPHDWHCDRRHDDRGADRVVPAGSDRLSRTSGRVVQHLRFHRHFAAQLCLLRGGTRRLYRCNHRRRHARGDRRGRSKRVLVRGLARQRDLHRNCVRRPGPWLDGSRRRPTAARSFVRQSSGRGHGEIYPHVGASGTASA